MITLQSLLFPVGVEDLTVIVTEVAIVLDPAPCNVCMNQCFGEMYPLHLQGRKSAEQETSVLALATSQKMAAFFTLS
jgi:hypothetical protein